MRASALVASLIVELLVSPAWAQVSAELHGVRSAAMGDAHAGVGTSNDTIYLNPAGMAIARRYALEFSYGYGSRDTLSHFNASVVDSKSGPLAAGLAYTHVRGDESGADADLHRLYGGFAYPLANGLAIGAGAQNVRGSFKDGDELRELSLYTSSIGVLLSLGAAVGLGATYHNIVKTDAPDLLGRAVSAGGSLSLAGFLLATEVRWGLEPKAKTRSYHAGLEYFATGTFPLRVGYQRIPKKSSAGRWRDVDYASFGLGWLGPQSGLEISGLRAVENDGDWRLWLALKLFM